MGNFQNIWVHVSFFFGNCLLFQKNFSLLFFRYCSANAFVFALFTALIEATEYNMGSGAIFCAVVWRTIPEFLCFAGLYFYDAVPAEYLSKTFRQVIYGIFGSLCIYLTYILQTSTSESNIIIPINSSFSLNLRDICCTTFLTITIFIVKNFMCSLMKVDHFVVYTTSLRRANS